MLLPIRHSAMHVCSLSSKRRKGHRRVHPLITPVHQVPSNQIPKQCWFFCPGHEVYQDGFLIRLGSDCVDEEGEGKARGEGEGNEEEVWSGL
jgi:hypothetical protein